MTWRQKPESSELEKLGKMTIRLIRILTYEKLARAQAQLKAQGVPTDFLTTFRAHAIEELERQQPPAKARRLVTEQNEVSG